MELGNLDLKCLANMLKEPTVDDSDSEDDAVNALFYFAIVTN